ncbi:cation:proton antiporter [Streptococcus pluranimalium]|uniref:cation:proton antiporter n=1 Tax=Streptococcus pluranimalium TaxID=82348 RepID=UPI0039FCE3E9
MLTSLTLVFIGGLILGQIAQRLGLPRMIGMLLAGMLLGPHLLNGFAARFLDNAAALRQMALVIILIKAGLALDLKDLRQVGRPAFFLSFLPASLELLGYFLVAPLIFGISKIDAALMGAVLAAVSPAVVVPRMVHLIEEKYGTKKSIPQLILAGASCDDIVVIVLFTTFLSMAQGGAIDLSAFLNIPLSIVLGLLVGGLVGFLVWQIFNWSDRHDLLNLIQKVLGLLSASFLMLALEHYLDGRVAFSGLLAIMALSMTVKIKGHPKTSQNLSASFGHLWVAAELLLFVLVGSAVDIGYLTQAGLGAVLMIAIALICRSFGVWLSLLGTDLNRQERLFTVIAYLPKATVQAAIGAIPLSVGLPNGQLILAVAVLGIVITAPLGAILMDKTYPLFLQHDRGSNNETLIKRSR